MSDGSDARAVGRRGSRRADVLTLQRSVGNAAVTRLLDSTGSSALPLARWPAQQGDQNIFSSAKGHLTETASHFADRWQIQALNAVQTADEPADPIEKENWYLALAGNVGWVFAGLEAAYWPLALLGAAAGSGVFAGKATPSGKADYAKALPAAADAIAHDKEQIAAAARECARRGVSDAVGQDEVLWEHMFPTFPFDSREAIYNDLAAWLDDALKRFHAAYNAWKLASVEEAGRRSEEDYEWTIGPLFRPSPAVLLPEVEKDHPFKYTFTVPSPQARAQEGKAREAAEAIRRQQDARFREQEKDLHSAEHQRRIRKYLRADPRAQSPIGHR